MRRGTTRTTGGSPQRYSPASSASAGSFLEVFPLRARPNSDNYYINEALDAIFGKRIVSEQIAHDWSLNRDDQADDEGDGDG